MSEIIPATPSRPWRSRPSDYGDGYAIQHDLTTLWIGDVHLNATPPGWRTESYPQDILAKLEWLMGRAEAANVDVIIFAGDIFHSKKSVPFGLVADFADVIASVDCEKIIIPGNHDLVDNNLDDVERRPIGLLARMPGVSLGMGTFIRGPVAFHFVPYVHDLRYDQIHWPGVPVASDPSSNRWRVLAVHHGITERTLVYPTFVTDHEDWNSNADYVFSGHIHDALGAWQARDGAICINPGSLSRGSLTEENLSRPVKVVLNHWYGKPKMPEFASWSVPIRPSDEVFRLPEATAEKDGELVAQQFLAALGETMFVTVTLDSVKQRILNMDGLTDAVKDYAIAAVENAWED